MRWVEGEKIKRQTEIIRQQILTKHLRPRRQLHGVKMSTDYGRTWRVKVLCRICVDKLTEPTRAVYLGLAGSKACDSCDALNF